MSFKIKVDTSGLDFDTANIKIPIDCPQCKSKLTVALGQVQRQETITCTNCQKAIKLKDSNRTTDKAIRDIDNAFDELRRALQDLGG